MLELRNSLLTVALVVSALWGCVPQPGGPYPDGGQGLLTTYTVTLRHFTPSEARDIIDVMARRFSGYRSHELMSSDTVTRRYSYVTSAQPHKMEEWLTILFGDMGLDPDTDVNMAIQGAEITVEKLTPGSGRGRFSDRQGPLQPGCAARCRAGGRANRGHPATG